MTTIFQAHSLAARVTQNASSTDDAPGAACTTAVPGKYGNVPIDACNSYYNFNPQFTPAVVVSALFGILTVIHVAEAFIFKKSYLWVLIMGALWETLAFILLALGSHDQQNVSYATSHSLLFLLAPLWINAFVYMTLARMVYFFLPDRIVGPFRATGMSKCFVLADILTFIVQGVGGSMASPGAGAKIIDAGLKTYMVGLGLQELFIVCFLALMVVFHRKALAMDREGLAQHSSSEESTADKRGTWKGLLFGLYVVLGFVSLRIFYRIAEFSGGITPSNPIPFHEAYSYALDAFPMMVCLLVLAIVHPGRSLIGPESEFPRKTRTEKKEEKRQKKEAKRQKRDEKRRKKEAKKASKQGKTAISTMGGHVDIPLIDHR